MTSSSSRPLVSVVTPFHNTERHLRDCIESVLAQSYSNFELLLQDNASDDGSRDLALQYQRLDRRIRYFRLEVLLPQVENYNLALTRIDDASVYTKIVQADDWLARDCVDRMVGIAEQAPTVGLVSALRLRGRAVCGEGIDPSVGVVSGREAARAHLLTPIFAYGSPTSVMYRSSIVRSRTPFFEVNRLHEDTEVCYEILSDWDFGFVHQILSYTRVDDASMYGRTADMDPGILDRLITLRRFGPQFLSPTEFRARLREIEDRYYRRLAWAALCGRGRDYWDFHQRGLATQGPGLDRVELTKGLTREVLALLAAPARIREVIHERRRRNLE